MLKLFVPDLYIKDYTKLNLNILLQHNIKVLVCDIDNTLVPFDQSHPTDEVIAFIDKIKKSSIIPVLISNNNADRVSLFAQNLDVVFYPFAQKPLKKTYLKVIQDYQIKPEEVACMGDQLMTDVFGANRSHCYTILTKPLVKRDIHYTKINRVIEKVVFFLLRVFKLFDKGEYDD